MITNPLSLAEVPALNVENLSVTYPRHATPALQSVSWKAAPGLLHAVIGPNGAGKSTLLKSIMGFTKPQSGKILFFNQPLEKMRARLAYIPQRSSVDWNFPISVHDVIAMGFYPKLGLWGTLSSADKDRVFDLAKTVGLHDHLKRSIGELSGGQQQRVFLARALAQDADLYILDEPFSGIDMASLDIVTHILKKLKSNGKTIIVVQHDLLSAMALFDEALLINQSHIASGPIETVLTEKHLRLAYGPSFSWPYGAGKGTAL